MTSITDNGTGEYVVNWDIDFSSGNSCVGGCCNANYATDNAALTIATSGATASALAAGSSAIETRQTTGASLFDAKYVCVWAFGDQ